MKNGRMTTDTDNVCIITQAEIDMRESRDNKIHPAL